MTPLTGRCSRGCSPDHAFAALSLSFRTGTGWAEHHDHPQAPPPGRPPVAEDARRSARVELRLTQAAFGLRRDAAMKIVSAIAGVVDQWKEHFQAAGVRDVDIQMLEQYIDGANLGRQRAAV